MLIICSTGIFPLLFNLFMILKSVPEKNVCQTFKKKIALHFTHMTSVVFRITGDGIRFFIKFTREKGFSPSSDSDTGREYTLVMSVTFSFFDDMKRKERNPDEHFLFRTEVILLRQRSLDKKRDRKDYSYLTQNRSLFDSIRNLCVRHDLRITRMTTQEERSRCRNSGQK
jgi:hypothetical protein